MLKCKQSAKCYAMYLWKPSMICLKWKLLILLWKIKQVEYWLSTFASLEKLGISYYWLWSIKFLAWRINFWRWSQCLSLRYQQTYSNLVVAYNSVFTLCPYEKFFARELSTNTLCSQIMHNLSVREYGKLERWYSFNHNLFQ